MIYKQTSLLLHLLLLSYIAVAQQKSGTIQGKTGAQQYQYALNLNQVQDDGLVIELQTPKVQQSTVVFSLPKIIPGTYKIADYGLFVSKMKAFDAKGRSLKVARLNNNQWKISKARSLARISYRVDDIFDAQPNPDIYPMAATNFEEGKNFVFNTPGIFGFLEGYRNLPFRIQVEKPAQFYASTSLHPASATSTRDVFEITGVDALYDHPIMYCLPDTASVQVGNCKVLVSVYSPNKHIKAGEVVGWMSQLLNAALQYLGGRLPADKYTFIYYCRDPKVKHTVRGGGALEHATSSFYYMREQPAVFLKELLVDISSHEFFHIITPLTIASKEIKEFNFNEAVMSKHLWLYEGVTEYTSHHVQVRHGMNTPAEFLAKLSGKIYTSRTNYNDTLSFTELSRLSAGKWAEQYGNVYEKGALIAACLDIYLLHLSNGYYGLSNLTHDLGVRFGRNRYFNDDALFDNIAELTYPEVKDFLMKYVAGSAVIPYEEYFGLAGIKFIPKRERKVGSIGNIHLWANEKGRVIVTPIRPNDLAKKVGYKFGDEVYKFNNVDVNRQSIKLVHQHISEMKEGQIFTLKIGRPRGINADTMTRERQNEVWNAGGYQATSMDTMTLSAPAKLITITETNKLDPMSDPTPKQVLVQKVWLQGDKPASGPEK